MVPSCVSSWSAYEVANRVVISACGSERYTTGLRVGSWIIATAKPSYATKCRDDENWAA
jgi:hypothetical protein